MKTLSIKTRSIINVLLRGLQVVLIIVGIIIFPSDVTVDIIKCVAFLYFVGAMFSSYSLVKLKMNDMEYEDERDEMLKSRSAGIAIIWFVRIYVVCALVFVILAGRGILSLHSGLIFIFLPISLPDFIKEIVYLYLDYSENVEYYE